MKQKAIGYVHVEEGLVLPFLFSVAFMRLVHLWLLVPRCLDLLARPPDSLGLLSVGPKEHASALHLIVFPLSIVNFA